MALHLLRIVRSWLNDAFGAPQPRPLPILLEDLYPPLARAVYREVRTIEGCALDAFDDPGASMTRRELCVEVLDWIPIVRRFLLRTQRVRHQQGEAVFEAELAPICREILHLAGDLGHALRRSRNAPDRWLEILTRRVTLAQQELQEQVRELALPERA